MVRFLEPDGELITIEPNADCVKTTQKVVDLAGVGDRVRVVHARGEDAIPTLTGTFDLVFVDHASASYLPDLLELERRELLSPDATVAADNVVAFESALNDYLEHVRGSGAYRSELHRSPTLNGRPFEDGVEVSHRLS